MPPASTVSQKADITGGAISANGLNFPVCGSRVGEFGASTVFVQVLLPLRDAALRMLAGWGDVRWPGWVAEKKPLDSCLAVGRRMGGYGWWPLISLG